MAIRIFSFDDMLFKVKSWVRIQIKWFFTEYCGWGGRVVRKRCDGNTRSNSLRTLWKIAWAYRRLEGFRGGFATGRQAVGTAFGLGIQPGSLSKMLLGVGI